jgi:hypothetical protein
MSTLITLDIILHEDTERERIVRIDFEINLYAGQYSVRRMEARGFETLTKEEMEQAYDRVIQHCLDFRRDIIDDAIEDLRGYPRGGGSD